MSRAQVLRLVTASFFLMLSLRTASAQGLSVLNSQDVSVFIGTAEFERFCQYDGSISAINRLEWLLNGTLFLSGGNVISSSSGGSEQLVLQLFIESDSVGFVHAGNWSCRANFTNGSVSEPVSGGTLHVFDPDDIIVPAQQSSLIGQSYTFQCQSVIPNVPSVISWMMDGEQRQIGSLVLSSAQLSDEGTYTCRVSVLSTSYEKNAEFNVVVPPTIVSFPMLSNQIFANEPVTLTVEYQSHREATTTVRWFKNGAPINSSAITTTYGDAPNATTQISFERIARENRGSYRVEVENSADVIPAEMRKAERTFEVKVQVPPSPPSNVMFSTINATHVMITWTLTNLTADAGADRLTLHLQNHTNSPFELEPTQSQWILYSEPGMEYNVWLKATNPDGMVSTNPTTVSLPPTAPLVDSFRALRVNATAFNLTLKVIYTGGGSIQTFSIRFREDESSTGFTLATPILSKTNTRLWYVVLSDDQFRSIAEPEFLVIVYNSEGQSTSQQLIGEEVLPGPPTVLFVSKSSNSLNLQIQISHIGTAPITMVQMNVTTNSTSQLIDPVMRMGEFTQNELIDVSLTELSPSTVYTCRAGAMNSVGAGEISMGFQFATDPSDQLSIPSWAIIAIVVCGSIILTVILVAAVFCVICCCRRSCKNSGKYSTTSIPYGIGTMPDEVKNSNETLNSASHRGSVRGGVVGAYTTVSLNPPLTPRSPTIDSCDSPYIKHRFESVTDSDGSSSNIQLQNPHIRHYTYSHSPGPISSGPVPNPLNLYSNNRISRSLTAFDGEPTSPQDIIHHATMV